MAVGESILSLLHDAQTDAIFLFLDPLAATRAQACSKTDVLSRAASRQAVWLAHSKRIFGLSGDAAFRGPESAAAAKTEEQDGREAKRVFGLWYRTAAEANCKQYFEDPALLPLPAAWLPAWSRIFRWSNGAACRGTPLENAETGGLALRKPVDRECLEELKRTGLWEGDGGKIEIPPEILGLWQVCDGQDVGFHPQIARAVEGLPSGLSEETWAYGLFGGYAAYDHQVSLRFLPLKAARSLTAFWRTRERKLAQSKSLIFAATYDLQKMLCVDLETGEVSVVGAGGQRFQRAAPMEAASASEPQGSKFSLLRWFREYARRLEEKAYAVIPLRPEAPEAVGICLCPRGLEAIGLSSCCVTKGVEVSAGVVYMPEHPQGWTYSISFRLVGTAAERGFEQCQLGTRTWQIQEEGRPAEEIHGDGVIGLYPILVDGGWIHNKESDPHGQYDAYQMQAEDFHGYPGHGKLIKGPFRYQSCSGRSSSMKGQFGGWVTFTPGTVRKPEGEKFNARLEPFKLFVPDFIY